MNGPYETEKDAREPVRHILDSPPGTGAWTDGNHRLLEDACRAAGVQLGAYDHRILLWLAGWEPQTVAVVAGLITRAHSTAAGGVTLSPEQLTTVLLALRDGRDYHVGKLTACTDCDAAEIAGQRACERHLATDDEADRYTALGEHLAAWAEAHEPDTPGGTQ